MTTNQQIYDWLEAAAKRAEKRNPAGWSGVNRAAWKLGYLIQAVAGATHAQSAWTSLQAEFAGELVLEEKEPENPDNAENGLKSALIELLEAFPAVFGANSPSSF